MPNTTRSTNLDLIRWLNTSHKKTAKILAAVIPNDNYLSKMASGEMTIDDGMAREIDKDPYVAFGLDGPGQCSHAEDGSGRVRSVSNGRGLPRRNEACAGELPLVAAAMMSKNR